MAPDGNHTFATVRRPPLGREAENATLLLQLLRLPLQLQLTLLEMLRGLSPDVFGLILSGICPVVYLVCVFFHG